MVRRRAQASRHHRPGDRRADWLSLARSRAATMAAAPTETTAAAWICRRTAIAMDQLGWGGDSCLSLSDPEVAPTEQLSPAPPPAGNPPLSPALPCCRFCRIACGIRTFAICFPCATRNFFLGPVLCTLLLRPHNAACCCARPKRARNVLCSRIGRPWGCVRAAIGNAEKIRNDRRTTGTGRVGYGRIVSC